MNEEMKLGRQTRELAATQIEVRRADDGKRIDLSFSASSETPVDRWYGTEILSHEPSAVMMDRLQAGAAPLLFNHGWGDPVGMIDAARVRDGRLYVDAHLFATARAAEVAAMIEGGLRNVSIGYEVEEMTEDTKRNTFTATRWLPLEVSIVTIPADASVGLGRQSDEKAKPVRVVRSAPEEVSQPAAPAASERKTMTVETQAAAGQSAEVKLDALEVEKQRRAAIANLCRANNIDGRIEDQWVREGTRLEEIAGKILEVVEERGKGRPTAMSDLGLSGKETRQFSLFRAVRAMRFGAQNPKLMQEAAYELECSRAVAQQIGRSDSANFFVPGEVLRRPLGAEAAQRAMAVVPGSKGGYLVNTENMGFIDILRNRSFAMAMGCRVISGLQGNVMFPRQTGKVSVTWQAGEGVSVTAADQALGQLSMTPKTCIAITDVSEQLLRQASPSAEAFIMADLAKDIAVDGVDASVINGTGGAQPLGIKNTTGVTTGQDASSATYAKILAFPIAAAGANAVLSNPGWVANAAGAGIMMQKQRFTSTDTPLWEGNLSDGTLVGYRAMSTEQVASGNLIFGSWGEVLIGEWGVLELATDNGGTRFNTAQVGIRAMWMVDVLVRYPQAFVVSTSLSA